MHHVRKVASGSAHGSTWKKFPYLGEFPRNRRGVENEANILSDLTLGGFGGLLARETKRVVKVLAICGGYQLMG